PGVVRLDGPPRGLVRLRRLPRRSVVDSGGGPAAAARADRRGPRPARRRVREPQRPPRLVRPPGSSRLAALRRDGRRGRGGGRGGGGDYRRRLGAVGRRLEEAGPTYAFHEYLAEEHHPQLVGAFLREAAAAGLAYVGDAIPSTVALELLPDEARERAGSLGVADAQQLVDFGS